MTVAASPNGVGDRTVSREHVRTMRMQRHLVVAGFACAACIAIRPTFYTLPGYVILTAFVGVVLGSLARAVDAHLGYWWGWLYGEPDHSTRLDVLVDGIVRRLSTVKNDRLRANSSVADTADNDARIRIIPLEPDQR